MEKIHYQKQLENIISSLDTQAEPQSLLLHSCCGPCSSYVLEYLSRYFAVTVYFYNPNIAPDEEYEHRLAEQKRLIALLPVSIKVGLLEGVYEPERYDKEIAGLETTGEGGERCRRCYEFRMRDTAEAAKKNGFDYFTTTLSVSPYKNAVWINEIGMDLEWETGVKYLPSDFKKKGGYQRSIELSRKYELYRQHYCGCVFSKLEAEQKEKERAEGKA